MSDRLADEDDEAFMRRITFAEEDRHPTVAASAGLNRRTSFRSRDGGETVVVCSIALWWGGRVVWVHDAPPSSAAFQTAGDIAFNFAKL